MKNSIFHILLLILILLFSGNSKTLAQNQDSAYIFAYSIKPEGGRNGLHIAWSLDKKNWNPIGPNHVFVYSDYGGWNGQKKMHSPYLFKDKNNLWHCIWSVNNTDATFAYATTYDLINWKPQEYPATKPGLNCLQPNIAFDSNKGSYNVAWMSTKGSDYLFFNMTTKDFQNFSVPEKISQREYIKNRESITLGKEQFKGTVHKVSWDFIDKLIKEQMLAAYKQKLTNETYREDAYRFQNLKPVNVSIKPNINNSKKISDKLIGIFFEDINYAADGGLYAELIENRGFEYNLNDKKGSDKTWTATKAWSLTDSGSISLLIDTVSPIHINNKHYAILKNTKVGGGIANTGFAGIPVKAGEKYNFSLFAKNYDKTAKKILIRIVGQNNEIAGEKTIKIKSANWEKIETVINSEKTITDAHIEIIPQNIGSVAVDMISLFPQKTFKGHKNGLRKDLAETIADLHPRFVRFPGGCVAHGDGIHNIYRWKNTIGPLETRKPQRNIWGYQQSYGLGYFEYFQFCEDIGAIPIPVIAAGVPCQNSSDGGAGQQGGVPMCDMDNFVQDVLDLIEYCNGDIKSTWGKKRAEAGHPKPFNLKYVGIGNEDLISEIFKERFELIYNAVKKKHPEITVIGTVGPFNEGSDYVEGWKFATKHNIPIVDEHYYQQPGWFINNQDFYGTYDRNKSKVYLGEYASWNNEWFNALSEAIYLTGIEKNGDIVTMTSYAPMLAKENFTQWHTDLIFFNNTEIKPTPSYEIQKLYGQNSGDTYIYSTKIVSNKNPEVSKRIGVSIVKDNKTGDIIIKLVNILPIEANISIDISEFKGLNSTAIKTSISGKPEVRKVVPKTSEIKVEKIQKENLPPYSFTLLRLKSLEEK